MKPRIRYLIVIRNSAIYNRNPNRRAVKESVWIKP